MFALLLIAQVVSSTPAAPATTSPAALGTASTAVSAKPKTLADLARERKLGKKGVTGGTMSVAGASGMPAIVYARDASEGTTHSGRLTNARADVQAARRAVDEEAVRKGMTSEDTAAARRKLDEARRELNKEREAAARQAR
ncbi:MAG: hypothetical protein NEA02_14340 [Thermoanaerobaculia bacterium]|nr:hypothetical protein [Thermoanaerobaculia bacterium]